MAKINHVHLYQPINILNSELSIKLNTISNYLPANNTAINLLTTNISSSNLSTNGPNLLATATGNISTTTANNLSTPNNSDPTTKLTGQWSPKTKNHAAKLEIVNGSSSANPQLLHTRNSQNPNSQNYLSLLVTPEDVSPSNQEPTQKQQTCTSNILSATVTNDKSLDAIFSFELEEPSTTPLFSEATLEEKPITAMYTDVKIDGHLIKLILDSGSTGSIITRQLMNQLGRQTPISKIDDLPIKINGIIVLIKVLIMKATQYQALVGNDWLSKMNATLDWNTQELQLSQNGNMWPLQDYQYHGSTNRLRGRKTKTYLESLLSDNNGKGKQTNELTWETNDLTWTDNEQKEASRKKKRKKKHHQPPLFIIPTPTTLHNNSIIDGQGLYVLIDNQSCLTCGETLLDEEIWNNIPGCRKTCNVSCQYTILISDWIKKRTPIEAVWKRAVQQLDSCSHDDDKIWRMAISKIEGVTPEEIRKIKNNPPEPIELDWNAEPVINFLEPEEFYKHYQNLAPTREELCYYCLIPSDFEYCDNCDFIYNLPPRIIYTISEEEELISSCTSESELPLNSNSNPDNDNNRNNSSSSVQNSNDKDNNIKSDLNSDSNYGQYIALFDLTKEQELK
ncbi:hypothetical protein G9A89_021612 [Geosiphon pyriformis]|nr:hypothetical protein G9A89_021612 [Geosiphon pyriformis]